MKTKRSHSLRKPFCVKDDNNDVNFRVVVKVRDSVVCPSGKKKESYSFADDDSIARQELNKARLGNKINSLFTTVSAKRVKRLVKKAKTLDIGYTPPNFLTYYCINCNKEGEANKILGKLTKVDAVELSYVETHLGGPPFVDASANPLSRSQKYLNRAPVGVDAKYAWTFPGGDGSGDVKFIDVEQGWFLDHEDLTANKIGVTGLNHWSYQDHGAAVLGVIAMRDNAIGGLGITPRTQVAVVSQWRKDGSFNTADAIMAALTYLQFGDVLLLEAQTFDPSTNQMWPVEILDANFQVIRLASALGIIVVEAAGNGMYFRANDLDSFTDVRGQQIFNRSKVCFKDSGAILVAAASSRVPHIRINSSNYGSRIDCFAWGENVATAGLFPRDSRGCTDTYSYGFAGTSSASAIIAGVAIAVQSITEAKYDSRVSPMKMRKVLSDPLLGTKSENGHAVDKIGVMPDLRKIINRALKSILCSDQARKKSKKQLNKK